MVKEIKLGEESDSHPDGGWISHFELYVAAMDEVGARTEPARTAMAMLGNGGAARSAAEVAGMVVDCGRRGPPVSSSSRPSTSSSRARRWRWRRPAPWAANG